MVITVQNPSQIEIVLKLNFSRPPWQAAHLFNLFSDQIHALVEVLHDLSVFKEGFITVSVIVLSREVF